MNMDNYEITCTFIEALEGMNPPEQKFEDKWKAAVIPALQLPGSQKK